VAVIDAQELQKELSENASEVYRIDHKGDLDNVRYRKLHSYGVPPYKRYGYGAVLGAALDQRIDRSFPEDKGIVLVARERESKGTRSLLQKSKATGQKKLRLVKAENVGGTEEHDLDFVELPRGKKRKRDEDEPTVEDGEVDYRSIEGKAKVGKQPMDSDVEYATSSDDDAADEDEGRAARLKNAEFSKRTREQPQDLDAWLSLIDHQREVLGFAAGDLPYAKTRTLADIRISIYEQALSVLKDPVAKAKLTLGMLDEGARLWEAKKLSSKWAEVLKSFSNDASVWTAYLTFIQSSHAEFRYEKCRDEYVKCLNILSTAVQAASGTAKAEEISRILVYVFLRLTSMMRDTGYHEFAVALWQAVLELHFFRPATLRDDDAINQGFEEFWESEVPRIGEDGANGWSNFTPDAQDAPKPVTIEVDTITSSRKLFTRFAGGEETMAKRLAMPGRSADEAGEDDPYHIVLFNDLSAVLFPAMLRVSDKQDLIMAFLRFAGLPPLPKMGDRMYEGWWLDPMLSSHNATDILIPHHQTTTDILVADSFTHIRKDDADSDWIRKTVAKLVDASPENDVLAEYHIALEYHLDPLNAGKIAKRLLKSRSSNLQLYNCYAIIQSRNKDISAGSLVYQATFSMIDSLPDAQQKFQVLLFRTWIWEALRVGDHEKAMGVLLKIGGNVDGTPAKVISPALELRVTRWLHEGRDAMLSAGEPRLAVLHIELLALLAYFKNSRSIDVALAVFDTSSELFTSRGLAGSPAHECLHQAKAQLITHHLRNVHLYKPALLRSSLEESIKLFPNNTFLLSAWAGLGPDLDLLSPHSLMEDIVLTGETASITGYSFTVSLASSRSLELGGSPHRIRSLFTRALASPPLSHNYHLWTSYLHFETETQKDFTKAREVFMRGLRELPWCKWWVVQGLRGLGDVLGWEDGVRVWNVLGERELRTHVNVEEVVEEEWGRRRG
jgi:hypothetical protein